MNNTTTSRELTLLEQIMRGYSPLDQFEDLELGVARPTGFLLDLRGESSTAFRIAQRPSG